MAEAIKTEVNPLSEVLAELKALRELREREEQARLQAAPSPIRMDAAVPAEPVDAERRMFEERCKKALENSPRELPKAEFSVFRFLRAQVEHDWSLAPFERYCMEKTKQRMSALWQQQLKAISWASGSSGGYWVATEFLPQEFINYFAAQIVCRKAGCRVIPATGAPVEIPSITGGATAYWVGQNSNITASDQTPGQLSLSPKFCVARTQISQFLANSSEGAAENIVREDLATVLALAVDDAMLEGNLATATPNIIEGLANTSGIQNVDIGTNGGALTMAKLYDMKYALDLYNIPEDGRVWLMHPRTKNGIDQFLRNAETQNYVFQQDQSKSPPSTLIGYPVFTSTQIAINLSKGGGTEGGVNLARLFLVNIRDVLLAEWGAVALRSTDVGGNAWAQDALEVKATYACDMGVRHATSVCMIDDSTT